MKQDSKPHFRSSQSSHVSVTNHQLSPKAAPINICKTRTHIKNILAFTLNKLVIFKNEGIFASREAPKDVYVLKL